MSENSVSQLQCIMPFCTEKRTSAQASLKPPEKGLLKKVT